MWHVQLAQKDMATLLEKVVKGWAVYFYLVTNQPYSPGPAPY